MSQPSTTTAELASLDGRIGPAEEAVIPATDEGFLRGDGAFEVIRIYDGRPYALTDHLDRLERSAANLRLPDAFRAELETEIPELISGRGGSDFDGCLRVVLTRGGRRLLLTEPLPPRPTASGWGWSSTRRRVSSTASSRSPTGRTCSAGGSRASAASTRHSSSPRTGACSRRRRRRSSGPTRPAPCARRRSRSILASITRARVLDLVSSRSGPARWTTCARRVRRFSPRPRARCSRSRPSRTSSFPGERTREAQEAFRGRVEDELAAGA